MDVYYMQKLSHLDNVSKTANVPLYSNNFSGRSREVRFSSAGRDGTWYADEFPIIPVIDNDLAYLGADSGARRSNQE